MYSKLFRGVYLLLLSVIMFLLGACDSNNTRMEFSVSTSVPTDFSDEKSIYVNSDMERLVLNAELRIDSGELAIQIEDVSNGKAVWSDKFKEDADFKIELTDLKANSEYLLKIQASQTKKERLVITCDSKLVRNRERPERPDSKKN